VKYELNINLHVGILMRELIDFYFERNPINKSNNLEETFKE